MKRFVCVLAYSGSERFVLYFKLKVVLASEKKRSEKLGFLIKVVKIAGSTVRSDVGELSGAQPHRNAMLPDNRVEYKPHLQTASSTVSLSNLR